ncbi:MAG: hypothetical protein WEA80_10890 [Gemmatimonadaceae bacterium]
MTATVSCDCIAGWNTATMHDITAWQAPWSDGAQSVPGASPEQDSDSAGIDIPACAVSAMAVGSSHADSPAASESWSTSTLMTSAPNRRMESMGEKYPHGGMSAVRDWGGLLSGKR